MGAAEKAEFDKALGEKDVELAKLRGEIEALKAAEQKVVVEKADAVKQAAEAVAKSTELEARLAKIENAAEVAKLRAELTGAGVIVDVDKMVMIVRALQKTDAAAADSLVAELKTGAARASKASLFAEIGKSGGGSASTGAEAKIEAAVVEHRKANPTDSYAVAYTKVLKAQPELYTEHLAGN